MTNANYSYISSSGVRELLAFDGDINQLVPTGVAELINKYQKRKTK
jgi:pantetheine-phosphate adenylyltransferase